MTDLMVLTRKMIFWFALLIPTINAVVLNGPNNRIVNGKNVSIESVPYVMSLRYDGVHICSAFIPREGKTAVTAVTAAQCVYGLPAEKLTVRIGSSFIDHGGEIYEIDNLEIHSKYSPRNLDYDFAKFTIKNYHLPRNFKPAKFSKRTIYYPTPVFVGWGKTQEGGAMSNQLQMVELPLVDFHVCQYHYKRLTKRMLCAGYMSGLAGPCQGDQGGLLLANGDALGWFSFSYGCSTPNYPGVFTDALELLNEAFE